MLDRREVRGGAFVNAQNISNLKCKTNFVLDALDAITFSLKVVTMLRHLNTYFAFAAFKQGTIQSLVLTCLKARLFH
jgi:hypothetical protein